MSDDPVINDMRAWHAAAVARRGTLDLDAITRQAARELNGGAPEQRPCEYCDGGKLDDLCMACDGVGTVNATLTDAILVCRELRAARERIAGLEAALPKCLCGAIVTQRGPAWTLDACDTCASAAHRDLPHAAIVRRGGK